MSLFRQLQRLYRADRFQIEDFHTEIVAQVLRNSPALTLNWLQGIGATGLKTADRIRIATQEEFAKLEGHSTASRPDITIRLAANGERELIFVESKLPSTQGCDQLQRYADHLHAAIQREALKSASLVFITRDYEAAETPKLENPKFNLTFQRTRWFQFYRYLKAHVNSDGLAEELKLFMEENRMSLGKQFRSTDLVALENFLSAKALMDETLDGEISQEASRILGGITSTKKAPNQLRDWQRYIITSANWNDIICLIGYWLPHENPDKPVWVGVNIQSNPNSASRRDVVDAFRGWLTKAVGDWLGDGIGDDDAWCSIYKGKPVHALMDSPDHVRAIKDHFLGLLKEVEDFRKAYPKLPWSTTDATESGD